MVYYIYPEDQNNNEEDRERQIQEQLERIKQYVLARMTRKARERIRFVELAHPEKALKAYIYLYQLLSSGRISEVDDNTLKKVLEKIAEIDTPKFRFRWK